MMTATAPTINIMESSPEIAIYNNGVPSMVLTCEQDIYNILHGIEDPIECYPPDAQDAAELEACEAFVETMAYLAMLEEREERARTTMKDNEESNPVYPKRWEVRRQQGLAVGKRPKPAKHSIHTIPHLSRCAVLTKEQSLVKAVPQSHHPTTMMMSGQRRSWMTSNQNKKFTTANMMMHTMHRPIQQPRKQY